MSGIILTTKQILNLCEFAGIAIDKANCCFDGKSEEYLLDTEFAIAQNEHGAVAYLYEYPEEGAYPLSGDPHFLKAASAVDSIGICGTGHNIAGSIIAALAKNNNIGIVRMVEPPSVPDMMCLTIPENNHFEMIKPRERHLQRCQPWKRKKKGRS